MNSYSTLQKNIATLVIITFVAFISPISMVNAATGTLIATSEVPTPTNNVTPSYTFSSDASGSIAYTGPCTSSTPLASTGSNTITFNTLSEGTYSTCTIQVDNGEGPSNLLTLAPFIIDTTKPEIFLTGSTIETILSGSIYTDSGAYWTDTVDGSGDILLANS